jgi:hypothetical protein
MRSSARASHSGIATRNETTAAASINHIPKPPTRSYTARSQPMVLRQARNHVKPQERFLLLLTRHWVPDSKMSRLRMRFFSVNSPRGLYVPRSPASPRGGWFKRHADGAPLNSLPGQHLRSVLWRMDSSADSAETSMEQRPNSAGRITPTTLAPFALTLWCHGVSTTPPRTIGRQAPSGAGYLPVCRW